MRSATKLAILDQKYTVAREIRQLAALQYGRESKQFKAADAKCTAAVAKYEAEKLRLGALV